MSVRTMVDRLEMADRLDRVGEPLRRGVQALLRGRVRDALHGVWLGHPLHPALVQAPVGAWLSTAVLDAVPGAVPTTALLHSTGRKNWMPPALKNSRKNLELWDTHFSL